ncbi:hypothetical protein ACTWP5_17645, partial [Streptomyces sp. 4N509B]|uniref:hypothetical protein n=1 Tax=Streptomyces sp. 4N509B TaxID=3457413 RepID=UPI003FCF066D
DLATLQRLVADARERLRLRVTAETALLDATAELGELAGAHLKEHGYSPAPTAGDGPAPRRVREEFGDVLFSLLSFANAAGVDARAELTATLARYEARFGAADGTDDVVDGTEAVTRHG